MRDALSTQDMGVVVAAYRRHPQHGHRALAQTRVARWLGITQGQLSRIESGVNKVSDLDRLRSYAQALKIPAELLWFAPADPAPLSRTKRPISLPGGVRRPSTTGTRDAALADSLLATLLQYSTTDNMTGPRPMLPLAETQAAFIDSLLETAAEPARGYLLYVGARFSEFLGWLHQDDGNLRAAMRWSNRALDLATEVKRPDLISYVLMRKSNIAQDAGRPDMVLNFARAAVQNTAHISSRMHALAARQEAHAHAALGDWAACAAALDAARELAADPADDRDIARYCTSEYIEMEAAHCWVELGQPDRALGVLQQGLVQWRPEFRRDLGLGLARFAVAHARTGAVDDALDIAQESLQIAAGTHSARTVRELYRASEILQESGARIAGADLRHVLNTTLNLRR
ncbi:helix-turn-helix domain-containing protein [Myceligenerans cantabricum]